MIKFRFYHALFFSMEDARALKTDSSKNISTCMFILTTKAVSIRVYDLKHPTIFPSFRKSFFPVSVSTSTEFLYTCSHFDSPSLCKRCHPQLFTPLIIWEFSSKTHSLRVFYSQVMFMSSYWSFYF